MLFLIGWLFWRLFWGVVLMVLVLAAVVAVIMCAAIGVWRLAVAVLHAGRDRHQHGWDGTFNPLVGRWYRECEGCGRVQTRRWLGWRTFP